jgi:hypothetical protein
MLPESTEPSDMDTRDELAGLRHLLNGLEHGGMTMHLNGKNVTKQEADKLRQDIAYLEKALARTRGGNA